MHREVKQISLFLALCSANHLVMVILSQMMVLIFTAYMLSGTPTTLLLPLAFFSVAQAYAMIHGDESKNIYMERNMRHSPK
jgi:hypothetical protein